ncbi:MAG: ankyrin repeat domain-containing protein, partial [Rickettsiaceae bacterium]|nr:ankyrin repeat domain-containing protein [Rickettsiaceae bacterium]
MIEFEGYNIFHEGGMIPVTQEILNEIIANAPEGEALNLKEVLESRGYNQNLARLKLDFSNNKSSMVDFSGLSLNYLRINNLEMGKCIFNDTFLSYVTFFNSDKVDQLHAAPYMGLIDITVKKEDFFSQEDLIKATDGKLNNKGICFGIQLEFARFAYKRMDKNGNINIERVSKEFIEKLNRKAQEVNKDGTYKSSDDFYFRNMLYLDSQSFNEVVKRNMHQVDDSSVKRNGFLASIPLEMNRAKMIGFGYAGHTVNVFRERNEAGEERYVVFNSDIGIIDGINTPDDLGDFISKFLNVQCGDLSKKVVYTNLDKTVEDLGLVPNQNSVQEMNYKGKYQVDIQAFLSSLRSMINAESKEDVITYEFMSKKIMDHLPSVDFIESSKSIVPLAVKSGSVDIINKLFDNGVNPNLSDYDSMTALHTAVRFKKIDVVKFLISRDDLDVNVLTRNGKTSLHIAVELGDVEAIKELLKSPKIDTSIKYKDKDVIDLAFEKKGDSILDVMIENHQKFDSLELFDGFVSKGRYDLALKLVEKGADIDFEKRDGVEQSVLEYLVNTPKTSEDIYSLIDIISKKSKNLDEPNELGEPLVHVALKNQDERSITILLANGASPNVQDSDGNTLLMSSIYRRKEDLVSNIFDNYNPDLSVQNKEGLNALHMVVRYDYSPGLLKRVLDGGVDLNAQDRQGRTPLHIAINQMDEGSIKCAKELIKSGARIDIPGEEGRTLFHGICQKQAMFEIAAKAVNDNISLNLQDAYGETPFLSAIKTRNYDLAKMMIEKDPSVLQHRTNENENVIDFICRKVDLKEIDISMVEFCIDRGADLKTATNLEKLLYYRRYDLAESVLDKLDKFEYKSGFEDSLEELIKNGKYSLAAKLLEKTTNNDITLDRTAKLFEERITDNNFAKMLLLKVDLRLGKNILDKAFEKNASEEVLEGIINKIGLDKFNEKEKQDILMKSLDK